MAKLKGPLFSLGASQKLGNALVYFGWKGLDVVREYVIPSNPRTAGQTTQRGYVTACVSKIHDVQALAANPLDEADQIALSQLGLTRATPRTWFNEQCKLWIDCKVAGDVPIVYSNGTTHATLNSGVTVSVILNEETASQLAAGKFYFGKSRTALIHSYAATIVAGSNANLPATDMSAWMSAGDKIYWQFRPDSGDPCEGADSGIYTFVAT